MFLVPLEFVLYLINYLAGVSSRVSNYISTSQVNKVFVLCIIVGLLILLMRHGVLRNFLLKLYPLLCLILVACEAFAFINRPSSRIVFIDVGQGDSALIINGNISILVDGGTYESGPVLEDVLNYYGIHAPTYVITYPLG